MSDQGKEYLGDGVYASIDIHDDIMLTTGDGIEDTNVIFLEPITAVRLVTYITKHLSDDDLVSLCMVHPHPLNES